MTEKVETLRMTMAMPTKDDWDRVFRFVGFLSVTLDEDSWPEEMDRDEDDLPSNDCGVFWEEARCAWTQATHRGSLTRCLYAGHTALHGACDPESDTVALHPLLTEALEAAMADRPDAADLARRALEHVAGKAPLDHGDQT